MTPIINESIVKYRISMGSWMSSLRFNNLLKRRYFVDKYALFKNKDTFLAIR